MRIVENGLIKYVVTDREGDKYKATSIGVNHTAIGVKLGGFISSYNEMIDNEDVINIENGIGDIRMAKLGNISEAYDILKKIIEEKNPQNFFEYCECVQETIINYFGNYDNFASRLNYFPSEEDIRNEIERGKISDLAHKNAAACVERAVLSHNLLKTIGIDSILKCSGFISNGNQEAHVYNLTKNNGRYYIFDSTQPTLRDGVISPIICEIPEEVYNEIREPMTYGYSVELSHYNPLMNKEYNVIYDAGRNQIYNVVNEDVKSK